MIIKSFQSQYELVEFYQYINHVNDDAVNIIELLINYLTDNFREQDFTSIFIAEDRK